PTGAFRAGERSAEGGDVEAAVRDPYDPGRLWGAYDSGDHLHPSDRGYVRMAKEFELRLLEGSVPAEL
ncbi:SGNH/GDSL hydrolase family protein, partial [Streptomyces pilosus]